MRFSDIRNNQGRSPASADDTCRDLDYSGYHKTRVQLLFYYTLFYGKYKKNYCVQWR